MNVIGISAYYHESACCLLQNGVLVAAAAEERFSRVKHDFRLPLNAFRYCLDAGRIGISDVDCLAYYENPVKKLARQLWAGQPEDTRPELDWLDCFQPEREIRERLGYEGVIDTFDHHLSHAASAFFYSGFPDAAILVSDGVGEWATTTYAAGRGSAIEILEEVEFPHSLGLFYATITSFLGFRVLSGEYKVMGLAPYGQPRLAEPMRAMIRSEPRGQYRLDLTYFDFMRRNRMYSDALTDLLGGPPRAPEAPLTSFHHDVARSAQMVLEEVLLEKVRYLKQLVNSPNLCLAGGVALNCVANGRLLREGPFENLFVQPAATDAGGALGAAALAHVGVTGSRHANQPMEHVYLGPGFSADSVAKFLRAMELDAADFRDREPDLLAAVVERLKAGQVIAWFHGRMEFGPRALGARSILADPRRPDMRDRLNRLVKKREAFRPFAPAVLANRAGAHFALDHASPFMLETCRVTSKLDLPAITHVDQSARPQTVDPAHAPRFARLIAAFESSTGCPVLVNTSFNVRDEPIVCSPTDAVLCMLGSEIDCLVMEDFIIDRAKLPDGLIQAAHDRRQFVAGDDDLQERASPLGAVYTFV